MPSICFTPIRLPVIRVTTENSCGTVVTGASATFTSTGLTTVAMAVNQEDRQDYFALNADAAPCITDTAPPILKWIDLTITFCAVDPQMITVLTGEPLVVDDSTVPVAVGWRTSVGSVNTVNFGFEGWTRIGGSGACAAGSTQYGYFLLPWVTEGILGDVTFENGAATFTVTARTQAGGNWGVGPYSVIKSNATATPGYPMPLLTPIGTKDHRHLQLTTLAPPLGVCGPQTLPAGTLSMSAAARVVTLTFPTPSILPATINWGDGTAPVLVTTGTTTTHTYTAAGTYAVTMVNNSGVSQPFYAGSITVT
jgi:hypothetical protein